MSTEFPNAERIAHCYRLADGRIAEQLIQRDAINDPLAMRVRDKASGKRIWVRPIATAETDDPSGDGTDGEFEQNCTEQ